MAPARRKATVASGVEAARSRRRRGGPATGTGRRGVEDEDGGIGRQRGDDVGEGADPDREMEMGSGEVGGDRGQSGG